MVKVLRFLQVLNHLLLNHIFKKFVIDKSICKCIFSSNILKISESFLIKGDPAATNYAINVILDFYFTKI